MRSGAFIICLKFAEIDLLDFVVVPWKKKDVLTAVFWCLQFMAALRRSLVRELTWPGT